MREVAGESVCSGGCGRGGVCGGCLRCLRSSSSSFLYRNGVLGCAGFFIFLCVRDDVLGFHSFFFNLRLRLLRTRISGLPIRPFPRTRTQPSFGNGR